MLQLVNLLRLHLVVRFHILLTILAPVITGHLGEARGSKSKLNTSTHQVCRLAREGGEIMRRGDHNRLTRCWLLRWVETRGGFLWTAFPPLLCQQADHAAPLGKVQWSTLCQLFQFCERFVLLLLTLLLHHSHCGRQRLQVESVNRLSVGESQIRSQ